MFRQKRLRREEPLENKIDKRGIHPIFGFNLYSEEIDQTSSNENREKKKEVEIRRLYDFKFCLF